MKFLVDVCAGGRLSEWLRKKGFDVKEVREKDNSMPDEDVIDWAVKDNRIIVTLDKDFGELFIAQGRKCNIIRLPDVSPEQRIILINLVLKKHIDKLHENVVITVSEKRIRIRFFN